MALVEKFQADIILLAGYVWATTDIILDNYLVINVHPADLAVLGDDGHRVLAGANGIKSAFDLNMESLRASSHLATKELDAGPLLVRSPKVPVDYTLHTNYEERFRYYLKLVNEQSRMVGARTILELALGNFFLDENHHLFYREKAIPQGLTIEDWIENKPNFQRDLPKLLNPKSVAVIGASSRSGIGHAIIKNLLNMNYKGKIYPVNKKGEDVLGLGGFSSISEIPGAVDLAVLSVPSSGVLAMAEECGKKEFQLWFASRQVFVKSVAKVFNAKKSYLTIVNKYNMRMLGPNCMGIANTSEVFDLVPLSFPPPLQQATLRFLLNQAHLEPV